MKRILLIILITVLFSYCNIFKSGQNAKGSNGSTASKSEDRARSYKDDLSNDTMLVSGTQYIPIEGRSETGTRADLEGAWELYSLNGAVIPGRSNLNIQPIPRIPEGTEIRHDSTSSTKVVNGVTHTTTSVLIDKSGTPGNKITPPQGTNYHIPVKPAISFFGANETFSGFTGCNKFSGRYSVTGKNSISLQGAAASTKMVCLGDYDEEAFLNALRSVNSFKAVNGQLALLSGDKEVLIFSKKQQ